MATVFLLQAQDGVFWAMFYIGVQISRSLDFSKLVIIQTTSGFLSSVEQFSHPISRTNFRFSWRFKTDRDCTVFGW